MGELEEVSECIRYCGLFTILERAVLWQLSADLVLVPEWLCVDTARVDVIIIIKRIS